MDTPAAALPDIRYGEAAVEAYCEQEWRNYRGENIYRPTRRAAVRDTISASWRGRQGGAAYQRGRWRPRTQ